MSPSPAQASDNYPWKTRNPNSLSPLRFYYRNCTDFVAWKLNVARGGSASNIKFTWSSLKFPNGDGNARGWKAGAANSGFRVDHKPAIGAVAWWGTSVGGGFGHVAIVTAVNSNGSVNVEEYNSGVKYGYGTRKSLKAEAYLHIKDKAKPPVRPARWEGVAGSLVQLDFGPQGKLWGVNADGDIFQYAGGGKWTNRGSGFRHVTVGNASDSGPDVYATLTNGEIRRWRDDIGWVGVAGALVQLDFGPQGDLWGVNADGDVFEYAGGGQWANRGSGFRHVTVGNASDSGPDVYATLTNGAIRRWQGGVGWVGVGGSLVELDFGPHGDLWGVNADGVVYQYAGSGHWTNRGTGFRHVTVGDASDTGPDVYATLTNGAIRRWRT